MILTLWITVSTDENIDGYFLNQIDIMLTDIILNVGDGWVKSHVISALCNPVRKGSDSLITSCVMAVRNIPETSRNCQRAGEEVMMGAAGKLQ